MKDFKGNLLTAGDRVLYVTPGYFHLTEGEVLRPTPKGASIKRYEGDTSGLSRRSAQLVKVDGGLNGE